MSEQPPDEFDLIPLSDHDDEDEERPRRSLARAVAHAVIVVAGLATAMLLLYEATVNPPQPRPVAKQSDSHAH